MPGKYYDVSAPAHCKRARSEDKDQGERTVLKWHSKALRVEVFNLERDIRLRAEKIRQEIPQKMDPEKFHAIELRT